MKEEDLLEVIKQLKEEGKTITEIYLLVDYLKNKEEK